jgi:transcriptional regulator with XRE-family HTH domain
MAHIPGNSMVGGREASSAVALFAAELRAARARAGLTQEELAARINYSSSLVAMIEAARRVASTDFARRCDEYLETTGTFARMLEHLGTAPVPSWFRPFVEYEATAKTLRTFEHALVPGLLQTEQYARGVLATRPNTTDEELEERVAARVARQEILTRDAPPVLWATIDEGVFRRPVGGDAVMREQLLYLAEASRRPNITIEVVPFDAGAHSGLLGACVIADLGDRARVAYLETMAEGYIVETPSVIDGIMLTLDTLRSEALPRNASRDLIMKWAENYGRDHERDGHGGS